MTCVLCISALNTLGYGHVQNWTRVCILTCSVQLMSLLLVMDREDGKTDLLCSWHWRHQGLIRHKSTFVSILNSCADHVVKDLGKQVHGYITRIKVSSLLIYSKYYCSYGFKVSSMGLLRMQQRYLKGCLYQI